MKSRNFAHLIQESPFYAIFGNGLIPIKGVFAQHQVRLEQDPEQRAYFADWAEFTDEQKQATAELLISLRGGSIPEFMTYMNAGGELPIRVSQTSGCSTDSRCVL